LDAAAADDDDDRGARRPFLRGLASMAAYNRVTEKRTLLKFSFFIRWT